MFSTLGNIFINKPREAEKTDARLHIRREEREQGRRKPKNNDRNEAQIFGDDDIATVSVTALHLFLENFLKSLEDNKQPENVVKSDIPAPGEANVHPENEKLRPSSGPAARAAGAYETMAHVNDKQAVTPDPNAFATGDTLSATDIRTIHTLLRDLKDLGGKVEYLTIERSESFLQSLVEAVEKLK